MTALLGSGLRAMVAAAMVAAAAGCRAPARLDAWGDAARPVATNELPAGGWWAHPAAIVAEEELGHE